MRAVLTQPYDIDEEVEADFRGVRTRTKARRPALAPAEGRSTELYIDLPPLAFGSSSETQTDELSWWGGRVSERRAGGASCVGG